MAATPFYFFADCVGSEMNRCSRWASSCYSQGQKEEKMCSFSYKRMQVDRNGRWARRELLAKGSKDGPSHHVAGAGVAVYSIWASPREPNRIRWGDTTSERENREGESGNKVCVGCCCLHLNVQRQWRPAGRERESKL